MRKFAYLLTEIEYFNGSTTPHHNLQSYALASELNIPSLGAINAHRLEKLGTYGTSFYNAIRDHKGFIEALKHGNSHPVIRNKGEYRDLDYFYEDYINNSNIDIQNR